VCAVVYFATFMLSLQKMMMMMAMMMMMMNIHNKTRAHVKRRLATYLLTSLLEVGLRRHKVRIIARCRRLRKIRSVQHEDQWSWVTGSKLNQTEIIILLYHRSFSDMTIIIGGGSYWAGRAAARPLFGPCWPPIGLARPLLATSKHKMLKVYCLSVLNNLSAAMQHGVMLMHH